MARCGSCSHNTNRAIVAEGPEIDLRLFASRTITVV